MIILVLNLYFVLTTYYVIIILDKVRVQEYYDLSLKLGQKRKLVLFNTRELSRVSSTSRSIFSVWSICTLHLAYSKYYELCI